VFKGPRYVTRDISERVSPQLQTILWGLIDQLRDSRLVVLDSLQVFDLQTIFDEKGEKLQRITHRQDRPEFERVHHFYVDKPMDDKILVIDESEYSTMRFEQGKPDC